MVISEALGHRFKITLGLGFFFQDNKWHHVHREESEMTHPVDEDIFGQTRVWVLDTAESIHDFTSVQLLHHLLQTSIYTHTHTGTLHRHAFLTLGHRLALANILIVSFCCVLLSTSCISWRNHGGNLSSSYWFTLMRSGVNIRALGQCPCFFIKPSK